jgi:hypothetical protein
VFGSWFGVGLGLRVAAAGPTAPSAPGGVSRGERPARLSEIFPPADRSDSSLAAELAAVDQLEGMLAAYKADLVVELGYRRPAARDVSYSRPRPPGADVVEQLGRPELVGPSEFLADEIAMILNCSRLHASGLIGESGALRRVLPRTWAALADGRLDRRRARGLAAELGGEAAAGTDPAIIAAIEAALLPIADQVSVRRLRELARRELIARDPAAADRRRKLTEKTADVALRQARDGCAELSVFTATPRAAAIHGAVDRYARMRQADGDPRPIGQIRVEVLEDLVLRPWDTSRPAVTATLTVFAPLGALTQPTGGTSAAEVTVPPGVLWPPAELGGAPITAGQLRALLEEVEALCPGGLQPPAGGSLSYALTDPDGTLRAVIDHAELCRLARRGCPDHPGGGCGCPIVDRPPEVDRYRPTPAQCGFVKTRDRTCRHPGCANRAGWADLDHVIPHNRGGPTACENLCCLCRRHHRLKTHARGWHFQMSDDGVLSVTTPTGITRTTRPPGQIDHAIAVAYPTEPPDDDPDDPPPF